MFKGSEFMPSFVSVGVFMVTIQDENKLSFFFTLSKAQISTDFYSKADLGSAAVKKNKKRLICHFSRPEAFACCKSEVLQQSL